MKVRYIVALLAIFILVGCAAKQTTPAATAPPAETPAAIEQPAATEPVQEEAAAPAAETEIAVKISGFDPSELTAVVGTKVSIKAVEGNHKFTIAGKSTETVAEGSSYELTLDNEGKVPIFDLFTKKSATIIVTKG